MLYAWTDRAREFYHHVRDIEWVDGKRVVVYRCGSRSTTAHVVTKVRRIPRPWTLRVCPTCRRRTRNAKARELAEDLA